ncbi:hypothetical protein EON83_27330 [bacterium]|nr:MAG: hypothetical protein EON83_27330 [bacterium]
MIMNACRSSFLSTIFAVALAATTHCSSVSAADSPEQKREAYLLSQKKWGQKNIQLTDLYMQRFKRNVTSDVIKVAMGEENESADQRNRAIVILGRLEDPLAEQPLSQLLKIAKDNEKLLFQGKLPAAQDLLIPWRIEIALGRIRARDLKGVSRLESIAKSIELTWPEVQKFGDELKVAAVEKDSWKREIVRDSYQLDVVTEFVDVLRIMGRRGEDLSTTGALRLSYTPLGAIEYVLEASHMSRANEAKWWLDRAIAPAKRGFYPRDMLGLGEDMKPMLLSALEKSLQLYQQNSNLYEERSLSWITLRTMLETASATGDQMYEPILDKFSHIDNKSISSSASQALEGLKSGGSASLVPIHPKPLLSHTGSGSY